MEPKNLFKNLESKTKNSNRIKLEDKSVQQMSLFKAKLVNVKSQDIIPALIQHFNWSTLFRGSTLDSEEGAAQGD